MIRLAHASDVADIARIWNHYIRDTLVTFHADAKTESEVRETIHSADVNGHATFVAEVGSAVLGFATYRQFRSGPGYRRTMEHTVLVHPDGVGRGLGGALMDELEEHAARQGYHSMFAGVSAANPPGRSFHEKRGYRFIATLPEVGYKNTDWLDLHLLQKLL